MNAKQIAMKKYRRLVATKRSLDLTISDVYDDGFKAGIGAAVSSMVEYNRAMIATTTADELEEVMAQYQLSIGAEILRAMVTVDADEETG